MSVYTTTIDILDKGGYDFGLRDYPIWDESDRTTLNNLLLNEYRFNEIGLETPDLWKFYLNQTMEKIMPLYVELYNIRKRELDQDLKYDFETIENFDRNTDSASKTDSTNNGKASSTINNEIIESSENSVKNNGTKTNETDYEKHLTGSGNSELNGTTTTNAETTSDGKSTSNTETSNSESSTSRNISSDFPLNMVNDWDNFSYATKGVKDTVTKSGSGTNDNNSTSSNTTNTDSTTVSKDTNSSTSKNDETGKSNGNETTILTIDGTEDKKINNDTNSNSDSQNTGTQNTVGEVNDEYTKSSKGYKRSPLYNIQELYTYARNYMREIVEDKEIKILFMQIYNRA